MAGRVEYKLQQPYNGMMLMPVMTYQANNNCILLHNIVFDSIRDRTHGLPHSMRAY